jgi:hypothetical protein
MIIYAKFFNGIFQIVLMVNLYQIIVNKYIIADIKCHKLVSKDGITTQDLIIDKVGGLFEGIRVNTKSERSLLPSIGISLGIMKNLDQYQYIVCSEIRSIPDTNPYKNELQKYRIAIIASFAKLVPILQSRSDKDLKKWNYFAQTLLTQISELLVKERTNQNKYGKSDSDSAPFDYFDVPEKEVDNILQSIY